MQRLLTTCALAGLMALTVGCKKESPEGGMKNTANGKDMTFTINVPRMATSIKPGEQDEVNIDLDRNGDFNSDVKVELEMARGLSATPASFTLRDGHESQKVVIAAAPDAPPSTQAVKVHATPAKGKATDTSFEVKIGEASHAVNNGAQSPTTPPPVPPTNP